MCKDVKHCSKQLGFCLVLVKVTVKTQALNII